MSIIKKPVISADAYIVRESVISHNVSICEETTVLFYATIRGDDSPIRIGKRCNIQEHATLHTGKGYSLTIGDGVTIGHAAIVHGCTVGNNTLIGMGAIIMNGAVVGDNCLIAAGALVSEGTVIPDGMLAVGSPAKVRRPLTKAEILFNKKNQETYLAIGRQLAQDGCCI